MTAVYLGPRSDIKGISGTIDVREEHLVFYYDYTSPLRIPIKYIHCSEATGLTKGVRLMKKGLIRKSFILEIPAWELDTETNQLRMVIHRWEGGEGELNAVRDKVLKAKAEWEEWACKTCSNLLDELRAGVEDLESILKKMEEMKGPRVSRRLVDEMKTALSAKEKAEAKIGEIGGLLFFVECAKRYSRMELERRFEPLRSRVEKLKMDLENVCAEIKECLEKEIVELVDKLYREKSALKIIELRSRARELEQIIERVKDVWPDLAGKWPPITAIVEQIPMPTAREILLNIEEHAIEQSRKWGKLTATDFIKEQDLPLPVQVYCGTKVIEASAFPWSIIMHYVMRDAGKRAGAMIVDGERQLDEIVSREGLAKKGPDIYVYEGHESSSALAIARASLTGVGLMLYMLPSNFNPHMLKDDIQSLRRLMSYCDVGKEVQSIVCSNGGTGKGMMLLAELRTFFGEMFIDKFRTRLMWWIGSKDDYQHNPRQLWDVPLVLAFHAFADTDSSDRKMIDIVGKIEEIEGLGALTPGIVLSVLPFLDYLTRINFLSSLWGSLPWKYDCGDAERDLSDLAYAYGVKTVFSLTTGDLLEEYDEILRLMDKGKGAEAAQMLKNVCRILVERALYTLGLPKEYKAPLMVMFICLPRVCEETRVLSDIYSEFTRALIEELGYIKEDGRLSLGLFIGNLPPCVIVRVFPEQDKVVKYSVRWLLAGSKNPESAAEKLKEHINRCIKAFKSWRGIDPGFINKVVRAWEKLRDEVIPEVLSELQVR